MRLFCSAQDRAGLADAIKMLSMRTAVGRASEGEFPFAVDDPSIELKGIMLCMHAAGGRCVRGPLIFQGWQGKSWIVFLHLVALFRGEALGA